MKGIANKQPQKNYAVTYEVSVQSGSLRRRRCKAIVIISISCSIILLLTAIIIPITEHKENRTQNGNQFYLGEITPKPTTSQQQKTIETTSRTKTKAKENFPSQTSATATAKPVFSWSGWTSWEPHNIICGHGTQHRIRNCSTTQSKNLCNGTSLEKRFYNLTACRDCFEWYHFGKKHINGIYSINPDETSPFYVYCDMTTDGGGWTVFQRRQDGSEDFYRNWANYTTGFGNLSGEFWLGNEKLHLLTRKSASLRVDLQDWALNNRYAKYDIFTVRSTADNYALSISSFKGTVRDSLYSHNGIPFSTNDQDHDSYSDFNCAEYFHGGWWYNRCLDSNLNGIYMGNIENDPKAVAWFCNGSFLALKFAEMKLRRTIL